MIPALIAAGSAVMNHVLQRNENDTARSFDAREAQKQRDYTTFLLENGAALKASGMRQAGLNPAFENGSQMGSTPTPSSSPTSPNSIQPLDPMALSNVALMAAQARKDNAEAENQEIENKRKKVEDTTHNFAYYDPDTHIEISDLPSWMHDNPDKIPDTIKLAPHSEGATGRFKARREINEFRKEVSETNTKVVQNIIEQMVAEQRLKDPMTILALSRMPEATYDKLLRECKTLVAQEKYYDSASGKFNSEAVLIDLEKQLKEDNNIMPYVDKAFNGDFSLKDLAKVLILAIMGAGSRVSVRY